MGPYPGSNNQQSVINSIFKRLFNPKIIKFIIAIVAVINIFYITSLLVDDKSSKTITNRLKYHATSVIDNIDNLYNGNEEQNEVEISEQMPKTSIIPKPKVDQQQEHSNDKQLYPVPELPYDQLNDSDKILYKLNQITLDKEKYWLGHTELTDHQLEIKISDFVKSNWIDKPLLYYDPRFTLSVYINEIKNQYLHKNPNNDKFKLHEIVVPFAWSDWVDLTMLNHELSKPEGKRKNCEYMKAVHHIPAKDPNYCVNNRDLTNEDLKEMKLPSTKFVPGFAVKKSPTNKASNEVRMLEGKSHLLTYADLPLSMIFLSKDGTYEAKIENKERIVDGNLFENYLKNNQIQHNDQDQKLIMDPVLEFNDFVSKVKPNVISPEDDEYGMVEKLKNSKPNDSKEIYLPESSFNYQQDKIDEQIAKYESRIMKLIDSTTNELKFDHHTINKERLSRNEKLYFKSLKYANSFEDTKEDTYFRMARLNFNNEENDHDAGWHYEWRFFNGALRYLKDDWNADELLIREKILLDRILRNWFRFANEKGIISWIAHGPLLSWYWDGLLFPFDEDIDIQMPAEELARFSKLYNQTLVVEDLTEGFGKYFIDCSTFIHHRSKTRNENHIDARFIDIDTGSYIDITGLGISQEAYPDKYKGIVEDREKQGLPRPIYNCRNAHFYSYNEISPLRFTMMGGVPLYVPNKIDDILKDEYSIGMSSYTYGGFYFVDAINLWIHQLKLEFLFNEKDYKEKNEINIDKFTNLVKNINETQVIQLLDKEEEVLLEYYLTKDVTDIHKKELTYLFDMPNGESTKIGDIGAEKPESVISNDENYHKFTLNFKFQKPFRRPLFNYENIDRPKHHND